MKKFISGLLGILFVVLVVVGVFICTYVFNQPSRSGDSRELISGTWTDKDANITFEFSDEGDFTITRADVFCHLRCGRSEERRVGKECRSRWSPYH